ncbi:MAG TPA: GNAT family N-acetyltransferase [Actinomycetota bacterium]|nr:GNAT family N-acetyltransferase [Actinomycetota bacterium]
MLRVDPVGEHEWATFREIRLRSLLDSSDAFGATYGEESSYSEPRWRDWAAGRWRGGAAAVYLAREDGDPVGTATVAEYDAEPGIAHIYAMWVAPGTRRTGAGRALLAAAASWARERGCERLVLSVTESNATARAFYAAVGFLETGDPRPLREGSDLQVLRMTYEL